MRLRVCWILFASLCAGAVWAQEIEMQVELSNPLGTETSRKGDAVSARVVSPDDLKGDIATGKVTNVKSAVKVVLVSQFGVSADRLTTVGLGSSKPIDSNDTPSGRAQNRRVELVKM